MAWIAFEEKELEVEIDELLVKLFGLIQDH